MSSLLSALSLVLSIFSGLVFAQVNYSDAAVAPQPAQEYERRFSLWGNGTRTYVCDPSAGSNNYTLTDLNYNLYPVLPVLNKTYLVGRRVYLASPDYDNGQYAFYTKAGAFTYWVGRTVLSASDPSSTGPLDLNEELEVVTERSEPKPGQTALDLGVTTYVTRYGAVGGVLPNNTVCTDATKQIVVPGTTYYSFWAKLS